jgi:hypothetical protein
MMVVKCPYGRRATVRQVHEGVARQTPVSITLEVCQAIFRSSAFAGEVSAARHFDESQSDEVSKRARDGRVIYSDLVGDGPSWNRDVTVVFSIEAAHDLQPYISIDRTEALPSEAVHYPVRELHPWRHAVALITPPKASAVFF